MTYELRAYGETFEINLSKKWYNNKSLAIVATMIDGEPYGVLTVNLCDPSLAPNQAYIDVNSSSGFEQFVIENGLGTPTGKTQKSGRVTYPLYEFNLDAIS